MSKLQDEMRKMQEKPFDFLVFSGGGAKGAIYSGVYEALKESDVVDNVKAVAGSSAGAITATAIAVGIEPEEFKKISGETNLKGLLGQKGLSAGPIMINKDATPLYDLLDNVVRKNISDFLNKNSPNIALLAGNRLNKISEEKEKLAQQKKELTQQSEILKGKGQNFDDIEENIKSLDFQIKSLGEQSVKVQNIIDTQGVEFKALKTKCENKDKILFKDLALVRLLDPAQFKDLLITAVRRDNGELKIFSAEETPEVEIAMACRASASIPIVFKPAKIDDIEYVDGGYRDNIPMKYFSNDSETELIEGGSEQIKKAKDQGRILACAFGSNMDASANIAIYSAKNFDSPNAIVKFLVDVLFKMLAKVGGKFKHTETEKDTMEQLRENALNTVVLNTQGISTLDFDDAQKYAGYLHIKGRMQTLEHFNNHEVGKIIGEEFDYQKLFLTVYEEYDRENLNKTFTSKLLNQISPEEKKTERKTWQERDDIKNHDNKAEVLLSFCTPETWKGQDNKTILQQYVITAALARNNVLTTDTKAMGAFVKTLNDPVTPNKLKESFIDLLAINKSQDQRLTGQNPKQNLANFKFTKQDFNNFLEQNKTQGFKINIQGKGLNSTTR